MRLALRLACAACLALSPVVPALAQAPGQASPPAADSFGARPLGPGLPGTTADDGQVGSAGWAQRMAGQNRQLDSIGARLLRDEQRDQRRGYRGDSSASAWPSD